MSNTEAGAPVVVVGAGAAGLMAALFAASAGAPVLLLEGTGDGGRKILISGGGRCNVLPSRASPTQFVTASSANTLRKILLSWPLAEQRRFFEEELGIALALEEESGKLFPVSNRARDVRDALVEAVRRAGAGVRFEARVADVRPRAHGESAEGGPGDVARWDVVLEDGETLPARAVVLATGGLSVPRTGSDGAGLRIARALGHEVSPTYPALTPLTAEPPVHAPLAGVSLEVTMRAPLARGAFETAGGFLFTHRGYSGPAVLDISHLAVLSEASRPRQPLLVRWTPLDGEAWERLLVERGSGSVATLLRQHLPTRLADTLMAEAEVPAERTLAQLRKDERGRLVEALVRYPLPWTGDEGYRKAEVTGGGVALAEVDPRTLESRRHPGLFLCGELLDAFGPIGGYNFLWAWATGRAAGRGAAAP
ncbi:MAG TPA: aminoacetone oxidase family FAD-binding enzyme [Longimicrobiales bacterium]|nr:aminoacetone oxidase family FAD-binding enzyme [Longimicrobiales bacterium]